MADIEIDHGESLDANPEGRPSTIIDFRTYKVIRHGVCFRRIAALLDHRFGIALAAA